MKNAGSLMLLRWHDLTTNAILMCEFFELTANKPASIVRMDLSR